MSVVWNGKAIIAEVEARTRKAIDDITEETAKGIVAGRWWESHSAAGLVSRVVTEPAKHDGVRIVGKVGTTHRYGFYGLFLEREQPFMRPVADETFPHLAERIRGF
jgi:hypothetical protein